MVKVAPSLLSADFGNLEEEIHKLEAAGAAAVCRTAEELERCLSGAEMPKER